MNELDIAAESTLQIDNRGNVYLLQKPIEEKDFLSAFFQNIREKDHYYVSKVNGREFLIEAFDKIIIGNHLEAKASSLYVGPSQDILFEIDLRQIYLDPWDRLVGRTTNDIPFVLSNKGQSTLFEICDYDDESISFQSKKYDTPDYYERNKNVEQNSWWDSKYQEDHIPGWDLQTHHPAFEIALSTLKLPKSKVLVLGSGAGHDAALFSKQGHIVTAIDFSDQAIARAKEFYGDKKINWVKKDIFQLDDTQKYDLIIDHTNYCAIPPTRRKELVKLWHRLLEHNGHVLGVFFDMDKRGGPPFGGSEYELLKYVEKDFQAIYWNRIRSAPSYARYGIEFMVYLEKITK